MPKYITKEEAFNKCEKEGKLIPKDDINIEEIKTMVSIAEERTETGNLKEKKQWNNLFTLYYDSIHQLVQAFLCFDKIKSENHQCLFAYLCEKYPELELDWDFFENIRTKRNGIEYYGNSVTQEDWKKAELQIYLYIKLMKKEVKKKIKEFENQLKANE